MIKYNISKPEKYTKDGQEKTYWANIGTMTEFTKKDGSISRIIEIPAISLKANIFPQESKQKVEHTQDSGGDVNYPVIDLNSEEINSKDLPF